MRPFVPAIVMTMLGLMAGAPAKAEDACATHGLPVSRIVEVDATGGPLFGSVTRQHREPRFLKPKEVVLTFDDGPMPWVTRSILDTLDTYCTKAMFFSVGRMAITYPQTVRDIVARGHTLGSHTFSHPMRMPRMDPDKAKAEIEQGLAAVSAAAGAPISPFFRFTGLADSANLISYLSSRQMASFSVDAVSNDSYIHDAKALIDRTMAEVERNHGGIVLFHDIKTATAKALPEILAQLKAKGYRVVQVTSVRPAVPDPQLVAEYAAKVDKALHRTAPENQRLAFSGIKPSAFSARGAAVASGLTHATSTSEASASPASSKAHSWRPVLKGAVSAEPANVPNASGWAIEIKSAKY